MNYIGLLEFIITKNDYCCCFKRSLFRCTIKTEFKLNNIGLNNIPQYHYLLILSENLVSSLVKELTCHVVQGTFDELGRTKQEIWLITCKSLMFDFMKFDQLFIGYIFLQGMLSEAYALFSEAVSILQQVMTVRSYALPA